MPEDALAELEEVTDGSSIALHLQVDALFRLNRWDDAAAICVPMTVEEPGDAAWWVQAAYATRRSLSLEDAETVLAEALNHHPEHGLILYNFACYACVRGDEMEGRARMERALATGAAEILKMAMRDPDLELLRPWLAKQSSVS